jgi:hypothetical protein
MCVHVYYTPGDQRRADIEVHVDGTTWLVDVGAMCPGTPRLLAVYNAIKVAKYRDQSNFVPFIVETGSRRAGVLRQGLRCAGGRYRAGPGGQARGAVRGRRRVGQTAGLHVGADCCGDPHA